MTWNDVNARDALGRKTVELLDLVARRVSEGSIDPSIADDMVGLLEQAQSFADTPGGSQQNFGEIARHLLAQLA